MLRPVPLSSLILASLATGAVADDAVANPAHRTAPRTTGTGETVGGGGHSWQMPAIVVQGTRPAELREEDLVGSYQQPRWTSRRRFTEVRTYVIPEGQIQFEYWLIAEDGRDDDATELEHVYEIEIGLPYRFQFDLYQVFSKEGPDGAIENNETKLELRWALADWGKLWFNPTLYAEWANKSGSPDVIEGKLLFSDQLAPRWHWGINLVAEAETGGSGSGGAHEREYSVRGALSYTVFDERLSIGAEGRVDFKKADGEDDVTEGLFGPSIQVRPLPQMHIDVSFLIGLNDDSPTSKTTVIAGWEF